MTVGAIMLEAEKLNDEELDNLVAAIHDVKKDRNYARVEEATEKLRNAWNTLTDLGVLVYDNYGSEIYAFDDLSFEWSP